MINWRVFKRNQSGLNLIEVLVAEVLVGIVVVGLLVAVANSYRILLFTNAREKAKNFAEYQMEYIQSIPYSDSYGDGHPSPVPDEYQGFNVDIDVTPNAADNTKQFIMITISGHRVTFTLSDYKVAYAY